jgi:hypothetical protein
MRVMWPSRRMFRSERFSCYALALSVLSALPCEPAVGADHCAVAEIDAGGDGRHRIRRLLQIPLDSIHRMIGPLDVRFIEIVL